jgi:hypothetical protein
MEGLADLEVRGRSRRISSSALSSLPEELPTPEKASPAVQELRRRDQRRTERTMKKDAVISDCGRYRYWLERDWFDDTDAAGEVTSRTKLGFIMLNPSTADARVDDPTIRRCISFAKGFGYGGLVVVNLFALRATKPSALEAVDDPIGPENDRYLLLAASKVSRLVAAWGAHRFAAARANAVGELLPYSLSCLGMTKTGQPKHPLYLRKDTPLVQFKERP